MAEIVGLSELKTDFDNLEQNLSDAQDLIAGELADSVRKNTIRRSGALQGAWKAQKAVVSGSVRSVLIDTSSNPRVTYSDVYERGRTDANYGGKFPAKRALDGFEPLAKVVFDDSMNETFRHGR